MRDKLIALIARADKTKDMHKRLVIYTMILNTPQKTKYLNAKEIANIYYNLSLNHMEICGSHFSKGEYVEAILDTRKADSDIKNAQIRYRETIDIAACEQRMSEYRNTRSHIIEVKAGRADASMSEFIKVSRLIVTTPVIPVICKDMSDGCSVDYEALDTRRFIPVKNAPASLSSLERLGFFGLVVYVAIHEKVDMVPQKPSENELGFNRPSPLSKTATLKRKLEKSSLRAEQEEKKPCVSGVLHL